MALDDITFSMGPDYARRGEDNFRVHESYDAAYGDRDFHLVWSSQEMDCMQSFRILVAASGLARGKSWQQTKAFVATIPASQCDPKQAVSGGRWWWNVDLSKVGGLEPWATASTWTYAARKWDSLTFNISITCNYNDTVGEWTDDRQSATYRGTVWMCYVPVYTARSCYLSADGNLVIRYSTTWERPDDRWGGETDSTCDGHRLFKNVTYGVIAGVGTIVVPRERLAVAVSNRPVHLDIRMNASFRPTWNDLQVEFARMTYDGTCNDVGKIRDYDERLYQANTPMLSATVPPGARYIQVSVFDTADAGKPISYADVTMQGAEYSVDTVRVRAGFTGRIMFPPLNESVTLVATGYDGQGGVSQVSRAVTVAPIESQSILAEPIDGSGGLAVRLWKAGPKVTSKPHTVSKQLSGRRHKSVYFGPGVDRSPSFSGLLTPDDGDSRDWETLPERGVIMLRFPDGRRYATTCSVTVDHPGRALEFTSISVSGDEVDA